ncbi:MAG: sigma-70 family RNA polymerase sigma factor [Saprospiraceae bacterium]|nr:sigma-70 family RNA polymerase sigma factor [Saprospiraceae bacterium]
MFNICYRMLNNREEAEDMLQESFVDVFKRLSSFKFESTFGAWFKKIVINNCLNFINKKKTELVFFENMGYFENNHEEFNDDKLELDVGKIKNAMTQLPSGGRVIFSLYLLEGYDHTEIAQILNISESTSKTQYMRAKNRVKELLTN